MTIAETMASVCCRFPCLSGFAGEYALQSSDALLKEGIACLMKDQEKESAAKAAACFEKAAEKGSARAAYCMGFLYYCGVGTVRDMSLALEWYRRAAVMGDIMAASAVGDALLYGEAGVRNPREAVKWYRMGAGQGDPVCQFRLGCCLEEGNGVPMDQAAAWQQYLLAALGGNREARKRPGYAESNRCPAVGICRRENQGYRLSGRAFGE